ncbi:MAG: hypothetical protein FWD57_04805, partial [Polyangiaceae bacterium]|nr:hypothetical protein [Polyangiaceae bacterium]
MAKKAAKTRVDGSIKVGTRSKSSKVLKADAASTGADTDDSRKLIRKAGQSRSAKQGNSAKQGKPPKLAKAKVGKVGKPAKSATAAKAGKSAKSRASSGTGPGTGSGRAATASKSQQANHITKKNDTGVPVSRHFTREGVDPLSEVKWETRKSTIANPDGTIVFSQEDVEVPADWSQRATDIVASKYFRKAGLHGNAADGETSVRQVIDRLATTIRDAGDELGGYFANEEEANSFEAELSYLLVHQ